MGLYIKGMEMPEYYIEPGLVIEFAVGIDGKRYARLHHYRHGGLTDWLEAISVPPHGRLIDADALLKTNNPIGKMMVFGGEYVFSQSEIEAAPTIIPAEEGE